MSGKRHDWDVNLQRPRYGDQEASYRARGIGFVKDIIRRPSRQEEANGKLEVAIIDREGAYATPRRKSMSGAKSIVAGKPCNLHVCGSLLGDGALR